MMQNNKVLCTAGWEALFPNLSSICGLWLQLGGTIAPLVPLFCKEIPKWQSLADSDSKCIGYNSVGS